MSKHKNIVTREGYNSFVKELENLKSSGRLEAAEAISNASEQGDLSENAEYDAAKEAQAHLERRIIELENLLKNCEIVETQNDDNAAIGKSMTIQNVKTGAAFKIKLVGHNESEPFSLKISAASPVGHTLIGKKVGEIIEVETPSGLIQYKVLSVELN